MEKKNILMIVCSFILLVLGSLTIYKNVEELKPIEQKEKLSDAEKFKKEYSKVSTNNVFVYRLICIYFI